MIGKCRIVHDRILWTKGRDRRENSNREMKKINVKKGESDKNDDRSSRAIRKGL